MKTNVKIKIWFMLEFYVLRFYMHDFGLFLNGNWCMHLPAKSMMLSLGV
jgi:hypothetical protein